MLPSWEFGILFLALPHSSRHLPFLVLVSIPPRWGIMTLELLSKQTTGVSVWEFGVSDSQVQLHIGLTGRES